MSEHLPYEPLNLEIGQFALLPVVAIEPIGAFLGWNQPKDLFLPYAEQTRPVRVGQKVLIYLYLDNNGRPTASMRIERNVERDISGFIDGQAVDLVIAAQTELGFKAVVDGSHIGVLYGDEVFQPLHYGQSIRGFIKKCRADGKLDLTLDDPSKSGHRAAGDIAPMILERLKASPEGFLPIHDKTAAEEVYDLFGVSKKKYKVALGGLYKQRLITVSPDGIRLVKKS